jgi:signal transduction histidine kinase
LNIWIQLEVYPTPDGFVTFSRDITARKKAEAALLLSEKLAAVGRLASSISHEINNPLEAVTNLLFLARNSSRLPEIYEHLDQADRELRRVSIIANQTLRFRKQSAVPQPIHSSELYAGVLSLLEGKIKNSGVIVERRDRAQKPVKVFEGDIRQVLSNLIGNAIHATPRGASSCAPGKQRTGALVKEGFC